MCLPMLKVDNYLSNRIGSGSDGGEHWLVSPVNIGLDAPVKTKH